MGNDLFGAFGRDFTTKDNRRIMIAAITSKQWNSLVAALAIKDQVQQLERVTGASFDTDEGCRFKHRKELFHIVGQRVGNCRFADIATIFDRYSVCWGPYYSLRDALLTDPRFSSVNPLLTDVQHPSGYRYLTPGAAVSFSAFERSRAASAPRLGEHTDEVLSNLLDLSNSQISRLHDLGIVGSASMS